jgi:hypothetical protein
VGSPTAHRHVEPLEEFAGDFGAAVAIGAGSKRDDIGSGYFSKGTQDHIAGQVSQLAGDGAGLKRHTSQIIRSADGKVMGESRVYSRHGGNLLDGYIQGGGFQCPTIQPWELENKVFLRRATK